MYIGETSNLIHKTKCYTFNIACVIGDALSILFNANYIYVLKCVAYIKLYLPLKNII